MNEVQLICAIKAHIEKGDKAKGKAEEHYIAAGQYLKQLKGGHSQAEFLKIVQEKIGLGKTRTYELLAIADGTKTVEQTRAEATQRKQLERAKKSVRDVTDKPSASRAVAVADPDPPSDDAYEEPSDRVLEAFWGAGTIDPTELGREGCKRILVVVNSAADAWTRLGLDIQAFLNGETIDREADTSCRIRGLLYRAQQSTFAAEEELDEFNELVCTEETREAVTNAAKAWAALLQEMNRRAPVEGGSVSKPQPSIAAPSHEPAPAVDPWDGLDIPDCLRRAPKAVTS